MEVRDARLEDVAAITAIYNRVLEQSTAIFRDIPFTVAEREVWFRQQQEKQFPILVVEEDGNVAGYASYFEFRSWPGYRFTVEGTIHLDESVRRRGVGTMLLQALLERARQAHMHVLIAAVEASNEASLRLLEKNGFRQAGLLHQVGYKFGRYLDLVLFEYRLDV